MNGVSVLIRNGYKRSSSIFRVQFPTRIYSPPIMYLYLKFLILVSKIKILQEEVQNGNATYINADGSVRATINPPEPRHSYEFSWELSYLKDLFDFDPQNSM